MFVLANSHLLTMEQAFVRWLSYHHDIVIYLGPFDLQVYAQLMLIV